MALAKKSLFVILKYVGNMAPVVKRLRPRIVVPICMGSNPIRRPIFKNSKIHKSLKRLFYCYYYLWAIIKKVRAKCIFWGISIMAGSCIIWESWLYIGVWGVGNNQTKCQTKRSNDSFDGLTASCIISATCFFNEA